jgi:hypothetical protein
MANMEEVIIGQIAWQGIKQKVGTYEVTVLARDARGDVLFAMGDDPPEDGDAGFASGCLLICGGLMGANFGDETEAYFCPYVPFWFFFM